MLTNTIKKFDNYRTGTSIGLIMSVVLLGLMIPLQSGFLAGTWFLDLIIIPALIARLISGVSYIFRLGDMATINEKEKTLWSLINFKKINAKRPISLLEKFGTLFGVLAGVGIAITTILLNASIPFVGGFLGNFAYVLYSFGLLGVFAGLGNRLGFVLGHRLGFSRAKSRHSSEVRLIAISALVGLGFGLAIVLLLGPGAIVIPGIPFLAVGALPIGFLSAVFVFTMMSVFTSAADYVGKAASYLLVHLFKSNRASLKDNMESREREYLGATLGVFLGLALGLITVLALFFTHSALLATGLPGAVVGIVIVLTCMGMVGGLGSRVCRLTDAVTTESVDSPAVPGTLSPSDRPVSAALPVAKPPVNMVSSSWSLRLWGNPAAPKKAAPKEKEANVAGIDNERGPLVVGVGV